MYPNYGALILAGGKNHRMGGQNKALLEYNGKSFLSYLESAFSSFDEKLLSANDPFLESKSNFIIVKDEKPDQGPLGGLVSALSLCRSHSLAVSACDTPFITSELISYLISVAEHHPENNAFALKDHNGKLQPLCGIYRKSTVPFIRKALTSGEHRVGKVFFELNYFEVPLEGTSFSDMLLTNINTPDDLSTLTYNKPSNF